MNVRNWDRIVQSWAAGDDQALDDAWVDHIVDLGSPRGQYEYVTNIGFAVCIRSYVCKDGGTDRAGTSRASAQREENPA